MMARDLATKEITDHVTYIEQNMASLVDDIDLKNTKLWEYLIERNVIDLNDARYIKEKSPTSRDQARDLLIYLIRRTPEDFRNFQKSLQCIFNLETGPTSTQRQTSLNAARKKSAILNPERRLALIRNAEDLKERIQIEGSDLLDRLVTKRVLTQANCNFIMKQQTNGDQVECLLEMMLRKNNEKYENFSDALWEARQEEVVQEFLSTSADFINARKKVMEYIKNEFRDMQLYTADGISRPVPMNKMYVHVAYHSHKAEQQYHELFSLMANKLLACTGGVELPILRYLDDHGDSEKSDSENDMQFTSVNTDRDSESFVSEMATKTGEASTFEANQSSEEKNEESVTEDMTTESESPESDNEFMFDDEQFLSNSSETSDDEEVEDIAYRGLFEELQENKKTRITFSGGAGSGKTSLMKYIGLNWASLYMMGHTSDTSPLKYYVILLPIILRLIQAGMSLTDIIKAQIPDISYLEANALYQSLDILKNNALLLFDGYDELSDHTLVNDILRKRIHPDVTTIVTTRPHGVSLMQHIGSDSVDEWIKIDGLNERQIKTYIRRYFVLHEKPDEFAKELISELMENESYLREMAKVPIHLEIICIVWSVMRKLGRTITDLYQNFVNCLALHMKQKENYEIVLKSIVGGLCMLANTWTERGALERIFAYNDLRKRFPQTIESMIKFGCLVKYHPSTALHTSFWAFSHLTLQEYFLALYLGTMSEFEGNVFRMFSTTAKIKRFEVVLKFLCGINPGIANKLLASVIVNTQEAEECKELVYFLRKLIPEYNSMYDIFLPLPRYVHLDHTTAETIFAISRTDRRPEQRNMRYISLDANFLLELEHHQSMLDISYVEAIELELHEVNQSAVVTALTNARNLQELSILGIQKHFDVDILSKLHLGSVKKLRLTGEHVICIGGILLNRMELLQQLILEETAELEQSSMQRLCSKINKSTGIQEIHLKISSFDLALLTIISRVRVTITILSMTPVSLTGFVEGLKDASHQVPNISQLELERINKDDSELDGMLGLVLYYLNELRKLSFVGHRYGTTQQLPKVNVSTLVKTLEEKNCILKLDHLCLIEVDLRGEGGSIAKLVSYSPKLSTLDMTDSRQTPQDLEQLAAYMPENNDVSNISFGGNISLRGGTVHMSHVLQRIRGLRILDIRFCYIKLPELLQTLPQDILTNLRVLDFAFNYGENLAIASHLPLMSRLQALNVSACEGTSMQALQNLIASLPPSVTHLDISGYRFGMALTQVLLQKERLSQLSILIIGFYDWFGTNENEVDIIREELQYLNPDILVYYGRRHTFSFWKSNMKPRDNNFWEMYRDMIIE